MSVSNIGQFFPTTGVQSGKNFLSKPANQMAVSSDDVESQPKKIDMRNVSPNEINELVRAGVDGLLDVVPIINIGEFINGNAEYREKVLDQKIDFIGQIEKAIAFRKSIGQSTDIHEKILANLNRIDGADFPAKVDISV